MTTRTCTATEPTTTVAPAAPAIAPVHHTECSTGYAAHDADTGDSRRTRPHRRSERRLPEWERRAVQRAIAEDATQHEIAARLGMSQPAVHKILHRTAADTPEGDGDLDAGDHEGDKDALERD